MADTRARIRSWQRHPVTQLIAVMVGVGPVYALAVWNGSASLTTGYFPSPDITTSLLNIVASVAVFGGVLLVLLWFACGERLRDLQLKPGNWTSDIVSGVFLGGALYFFQLLMSWLAYAFGHDSIPDANRIVGTALSHDPLLLIVWLGPVVWFQAALLEEFTRVFMLSRLWQVWPSALGKILVLVGSSLAFGLGHIYQGRIGLLGGVCIGLILGWHYFRFGRVLPLIIAHGLYNTVVLLMLVAALSSGLL